MGTVVVVGDPFLPVKGSRGFIKTDLDVVVDLLLPVLRAGCPGGQSQFVGCRQDLIKLPKGVGMIQSLNDDPRPIMEFMILEQSRWMRDRMSET